MMRLRFALSTIALAVMIGAAPSLARADAVALGPGMMPDVTIDSVGTAYVAWNSVDGTGLYFCVLPESSASCMPATLPVSDYASARPAVFVSGSTVQVLTNRCCSSGSQTLLFTSADGGSTFAPPVSIGNLNPSGNAVAGPGGGISMITSAQINSYYQLAPTDGSPAASAEVPLSSQYTYHGVIAIAAGKPVVVFDNLSTLAWTTTTGGDPNQGSSWTAVQAIGAGHDPHLASGPNGLFLLYTDPSDGLELSKFPGAGWSASAAVRFGDGTRPPGDVAAFTEGSSGALSIVYRTTTANPTSLDFTGSADTQTWSAPQPIATDSAIANLRLADAPDGTGVAVWDNGHRVSFARHGLPPKAAPPQAAFTVTPAGRLCAGTPVTLNATPSTPGSAPITKYRWDFSTAEPLLQQIIQTFGGSDYLNFSDNTTTPTESFTPDYTWFLNNIGGWPVEGPALGGALYNTDVALTVTNADGLSSSTSVQQLPFWAPLIVLGGSTYTPCGFLDKVAGPPRIPHAPIILTGSTLRLPPLACNAAVLCGGLIRLTTVTGPGGFAADAARVHHRARAVLVATARFAIKRGQSASLNIGLNARGRALARRGRLRRLRVMVTTFQLGPSKPSTISRVLTVRRTRR